MRRGLAQALFMLALLGCVNAHGEPWPDVKAPPGSKIQSIANDMIYNGRPARLTRFDVDDSEQSVLSFFRDQFGAKNVVEKRTKEDRLIAVRESDYFLTVRLHPIDAKHIQGTVMSTNIAGKRLTSAVSSDTRQLLPAESRVVSTLQSDDGDKHSLLLTSLNLASVAANRDHVVHEFELRGFNVSNESAASTSHGAMLSLQLTSPTEEAQVTIADAGRYRSVLINRVKADR